MIRRCIAQLPGSANALYQLGSDRSWKELHFRLALSKEIADRKHRIVY